MTPPAGTQSLVLLVLAVLMLNVARLRALSLRAVAVTGILLVLLASTIALPFSTDLAVRMGDFVTYSASQGSFRAYSAYASVRFEAHLTYVVVAAIDRFLGATDETPARAFLLLSWFAGGLLALAILGVNVSQRFAEPAVRYAALCLLAPVTLLFFGFREIGHTSLPLAAGAMPMFVTGIRDANVRRVAAAAAMAGVAAALHAFGLLSLVGAAVAIAVARHPWRDRVTLLMTAFAFGTACYLVWIFFEVVVLELSVSPGHAGAITLRPLFESRIEEFRTNYPLFSVVVLRDIIVSAWVAGVPVLAVAAAAARRDASGRVAMALSLPSFVWMIVFWPVQGVGVELDLVLASFPALFALLWVCAHDRRLTAAAAAVLASGHAVFWLLLLNSAFVNSRVVPTSNS